MQIHLPSSRAALSLSPLASALSTALRDCSAKAGSRSRRSTTTAPRLSPERAVLRVALLQLHRLGAAGVHPRLVRLRAGVAFLVDALQFRNRIARDRVLVGELAPALDDDAELRAPVADVVVADDLVSERAENLHERAADHRRADVPDVHRLGDVRAGVVDDDRLSGADLGDAAVRGVFGHGRRARGEGFALEREVHVARAGDFGLFDAVRERRARENGLRDLARRQLEGARQLHRAGALEIAEPGLCAGDDAAGRGRVGAIGVNGGEARAEPGGELVRERGNRFHARGVYQNGGLAATARRLRSRAGVW